jgi:phage terminase small subunit
MAGNERSGRKRLSIAEHLASGTFRPGKHGEIEDPAQGVPKRPKGMDAGARGHWDRIVPGLVELGLAKAIDASALQMLCELWSFANKVKKHLGKSPADSELAAVYRGYVREYSAIAKRFGLDFAGRQRMRLHSPQDKPAGVASRDRGMGVPRRNREQSSVPFRPQDQGAPQAKPEGGGGAS